MARSLLALQRVSSDAAANVDVRILLVSPVFHGYWTAMAAALGARGHAVTVVTYDHNPTLAHRGWHQLRHEFPRHVGLGEHRGLVRAQTASVVESVRNTRPEAVVVVKGDVLEQAFWDLLDMNGIPRVTWLYDEVRRTRWTMERLASVGPVATYSTMDHAAFIAAGLDSHWVPLAYDHRLVSPGGRARNGEVVFVGARYPTREEVMLKLVNAGVPVKAFGRDWSQHPVDRLRTWHLRRPPIPAGRDLDRIDAYREMAAALATLNIHGDQDGFTMRTFEASGVGGLQLIDREDVHVFYEPGVEVLTWSDDEELLQLCRQAASDDRWGRSIREAGRRRTMAEHTFDHRVAQLEAAWDTA